MTSVISSIDRETLSGFAPTRALASPRLAIRDIRRSDPPKQLDRF